MRLYKAYVLTTLITSFFLILLSCVAINVIEMNHTKTICDVKHNEKVKDVIHCLNMNEALITNRIITNESVASLFQQVDRVDHSIHEEKDITESGKSSLSALRELKKIRLIC